MMTVPSLNLPYAKTAIAICGGLMTIVATMNATGTVEQAVVLRTARKLMDGALFA